MLKGFKNAAELDFSLASNRDAMERAFQQVDAEKGAVYPLIIGGERILTEKKITSVAPSTKEVLGYSSSCDQALADRAIRTAYEAFQSWRLTSVEERVRCVRRLVSLLEENRFILDAWNIEESGKNWGEADGELCEALDFFNSYAMHAEELDKGLELVPTEEYTKSMLNDAPFWAGHSTQSQRKNPTLAIPSTMIIIPATNTIVSQLMPLEVSADCPAVYQK